MQSACSDITNCKQTLMELVLLVPCPRPTASLAKASAISICRGLLSMMNETGLVIHISQKRQSTGRAQ